MTGRRQRAKTARALASEEQVSRNRNRRPIQKPKYVEEANTKRSDTPVSAKSRISTPTSSRHPSRSPSPTSTSVSASGRRRSSIQSQRTRTSGRAAKGVNSSGSNTPIGRGSRSSSVASANHQRKGAAVVTPKIKTKLGRGYNPSLVNYKDSEYHYGSDFEDDVDEEPDEPPSEPSSDDDDDDADSDDLKVESDVELDQLEPLPVDSRATTPVPFWLRTGDEAPTPLALPPSSEDLLISSELILKTCSTYEILRHYRLLLRLSPFRFEDFCAALAAEEQSNLLSEVHVALLKSILRTEEKDNTMFAPMDQKDSVNCLFYFIDSITWPDCLRSFLTADPIINADPLQIMTDHKEYPITSPPSNNWIEARVSMLGFLADQFLATNAVREDIVTEGAPSLEDHCRVCHRLGDMLICEQCSGTFHLACLDPPLYEVPEEDWQCYVCQANEVMGVTDCVSDHERSNLRHEALGFDRAGNKYWFVCRRIFVEALDGSVSYYTSTVQFNELMESLDPELYEAELCEAIEFMRPEIEKQMNVTETLTNDKKAGNRKSYLELENASIQKLQAEREQKRLEEIETKRRIQEEKRRQQEEAARKAKEEEESKRKEEEEARQIDEERRRKLREERLRKREESRGDGFQQSDLLNDSNDDDVIKLEDDELGGGDEIKEEEPEDVKIKEENMEVDEAKTEQQSDMDFEVKDEIEIKEEDIEAPKEDVKPTAPATPASTSLLLPKVETDFGESEIRITRKTIQQMNTGTLYFKLGQEGSYKQYVNQFTTNPTALSKVQATEERVKKTHMSHKFSLTDASAFKWSGTIFGSRIAMVNTIRATMLQLENNIPSIFMHTNWSLMRKAWITAVSSSNTSREFARALTVLQCCLKPCLLLNVWYESLGHTQLKKIAMQQKEDKKKVERKERREKDEEEEKLRPFMGFVKYTLGLKHQVAKQRGEEYRAHGQHGWLWLSSTRNFCPCSMMQVGLRAGPHRVAVKYTDIRDKTPKIVLMEPKAFEYLIKKQDEIDLRKAMGLSEEEEPAADSQENKEQAEKSKEKTKLEQALKNARLERQVPADDLFNPVVSVERGLSNPTRSMYPRVAKKAKVLDDFLSRRNQLKTLEERRMDQKNGSTNSTDEAKGESILNNADKPVKTEEEEKLSTFVEESKKTLWSVVAKLKDATTSDSKPERPADLKCYSQLCARAESNFKCYSATCAKVEPSCPVLAEAKTVYKDIISNATSYGLTITPKDFSSKEAAISEYQNLVKNLMQKKNEVMNKTNVNGDAAPSDKGASSQSSEPKRSDEGRIYSSSNTSGKLYLKRIQPASDPNKTKIIKYPLAPSFYSKSRQKNNILILAKHDVKRMARKAGTVSCDGFNYNAKANMQVWPYPCPRPTFKTSWLYRTACLESIQAVALQLRIMWACIKWDDMHTKPLSTDGKFQVTTDSAITTTEILKVRTTGRFMERTEYQQRKVTIPLDVPKTIKEVMPVRAGLRKRKRAESPQQMEPKVSEEWVDEEKLELWEIRAYREKIDREKMMSLTRSRTGTSVREPQRLDPTEASRIRSKGDPQGIDMKAKMEEQLRLQREALNKKTASPAATLVTSTTSTLTATPTIIRRITNPDGTYSIVRTQAKPDLNSTPVSSMSNSNMIGTPPPKRIFVTKDGKIVGSTIVAQQPTPANAAKPMTPTTIASLPTISTPSLGATSTPLPPGSQQKVQIVRSTDGKIQVRGLLPGQQLVQMPDGKLQIFTHTPVKGGASTVTPIGTPVGTPIGTPTAVTSTTASPAPQGQKVLIQPSTPQQQQQQQTNVQAQQMMQTPGKIMTPNSPATPNQVLATQLLPGSPIPPGSAVFVSGGKTYCIPKAVATMAGGGQQPVNNLMQAQATPPQQTSQGIPTSNVTTSTSILSAALTNVTPSTTTTPTAVQQQPKQMVEVKPLGQNTVTFKGNQMIVQGPDVTQAQNIARQLSTGAARLAMLNGKQVLISTTSTIIQQGQQQQAQQVQLGTQPLQVQQMQSSPVQQNVVQPGAAQQNLMNQTKVLSNPVQPSPTQQPNFVQTGSLQSTQVTQSPQVPQQVLNSPISQNYIPEKVQLPTEPLPQPQLSNDQQQSVASQPSPTTPAKPPLQITAQLVQTAQGPRIILQGIQGASLPKEYLLKIQQQVKTQLLKAQAEAKQQNRVPPTKIIIQLPPNIQAQLENDQAKANLPATPVQATQVAQPVQQGTQQQPSPVPAPAIGSTATPTIPGQMINSIRSPRPLAPQSPSQAGSPRPVVLQQILNSPGQRFILVGPNGPRMVTIGTPTQAGQPQQNFSSPARAFAPQSPANSQSVLLPTSTNPTAMLSPTSAGQPQVGIQTSDNNQMLQLTVQQTGAPNNENLDKFELTTDYIQKAISDALKNQNLSPEIEQKLLTLQQHTTEKGIVAVHNMSSPVSQPKKEEVIDPHSGEPMDDEWEPVNKGRGIAGSRKKKVASESTPVTSPAQRPALNSSVTPSAVAQVLKTPSTPPRSRTKSGAKTSHSSSVSNTVVDEKKKQQVMNKLQAILSKQKEQLKKDIARKRAMQEKELQVLIHRDIEKTKQEQQMVSASTGGLGYGVVANSYEVVSSALPPNAKRKRRESSQGGATGVMTSTSHHVSSPPKKRKRSSTSSSAMSGIVKKNKVYCICKTSYDPTKFYVGCDVCNNWFHGNCVGISEHAAKTMSEYVCDECKSAKDNREIYCLCKQPYDESQFYIGCERCTDWFHGRCVGILQVEADRIDEYLCPRCDPNSVMNKPNLKPFKQKDYEHLKKLVKQLQLNRSSTPFKEPVNPSDVPNYYKVVQVPMDLQTVEERVNQQYYKRLCDFVGDVMRIFENCRFFNQPNTPIMKNAEALEAFFSQKLAGIRERILAS